MRVSRALLRFYVLAITIVWTSSNAQDFNYKDLPVIDPKPDFNGVDATSGSFSTSSPLTFSAPGAGHQMISCYRLFKSEQFVVASRQNLDAILYDAASPVQPILAISFVRYILQGGR